MARARLENWYYCDGKLVGNIYDDSEGRFPDGKEIMTSRLKPLSMQLSLPKQGAIVATQNTSYHLGVPYGS